MSHIYDFLMEQDEDANFKTSRSGPRNEPFINPVSVMFSEAGGNILKLFILLLLH
jgi:hypothetical protein